MTRDQIRASIDRAMSELKLTAGYNPAGPHYAAVMEELRKLEKEFAPLTTKPKWMSIGPVTVGGRSLLDMSLTHYTDGIPLYPAVDTAWAAYTKIIAPEDCTVGRDTSAAPGDAVYLLGSSGAKYWVGHITHKLSVGHRVTKGALVGHVYNQSGTDHVHVGFNYEALLGKGKQFQWGRNGNGPNYTLGAPTPRQQILALNL